MKNNLTAAKEFLITHFILQKGYACKKSGDRCDQTICIFHFPCCYFFAGKLASLLWFSNIWQFVWTFFLDMIGSQPNQVLAWVLQTPNYIFRFLGDNFETESQMLLNTHTSIIWRHTIAPFSEYSTKTLQTNFFTNTRWAKNNPRLKSHFSLDIKTITLENISFNRGHLQKII